MLRTADLEYDLPERLIAVSPPDRRDDARLMVVRRAGDDPPRHMKVSDLPNLLCAEDLLVFNTTRVLPARLLGRREDTGGAVEALYLDAGPDDSTWIAMIKARRVRPDAPVRLTTHDGADSPVRLTLVSRVDDAPGAWVVRVTAGDKPISMDDTLSLLEQLGHPPLPPYIRSARKAAGLSEETPDDAARYQTVFAETPGSVAAPTAGLHFTPPLLAELTARGVNRADVVLHVGPGTFKPVEAPHVEEHEMHAEWCAADAETLVEIHRTRASRGRVIPIGTTSTRTIETYAQLAVAPPSLQTRLLITPGFQWRWTDGLMTNFHLPRSTLMAMVGALLEGGVDRLKSLYAEAIEQEYRFYSYGDAMLILP